MSRQQRKRAPVKRSTRQHKSWAGLELEYLNRRLVYLVGFLLVFGVLMIYSASAVLAQGEGNGPFHYLFLQLVWVTAGIFVAYAAYKFPLDILNKISPGLMVATITLLILVLMIGKNVNGATRWIDLGPFDLQPSEVAKLGFTIYLSAWLARTREKVKDFGDAIKNHLYADIAPFLLLLMIISLLILAQPDLDTAVIIALTALTVYFVSGSDALHTLGSIFIVATSALVGVIAAFAAPYRVDRIETYLNFLFTGQVGDRRDSGFQVWNGLIAIGSGGIFGVGYGESRQKLYYLQNAAFTDSIYSVIAEEFGLIGSVALIIAFLYFMSLGVEIARKAPTKFASLLAIGITTWITIQAFLNIGANLAVIPFGGIPLPFISYGGSGTLVVMAGVGLLLNVSKESIKASTRKHITRVRN